MADVVSRRQALNDEAYKSVLQTLFVRSKTEARYMMLMSKLRKELNVSQEQHKAWLQQLMQAKQAGTLNAVLVQPSSHVAGSQQQTATHAAEPAGAVAKHRSTGPSKRRRTVVMTEEDSASDGTISGGESHDFGRHAGAQQQYQGSMYGQQQQHAYQQQHQHSYGGDYGRQNGTHTAQQRAQPQQQQYVAGQGQAGAAGGGGGAADKKKKQAQEPVTEIPEIIGHKVHRYWPKEGQWFEGIVTDYRARDNLYCITYHLGKKNESMEWFDIDRAAAMGNPQLSHYQLTPEKLDMRKFAHTRAYQNSSILNGTRTKKSGSSKSGGGARK